MRKLAIVWSAVTLISATGLSAQNVQQLSSGMTFRTPAGWRVNLTQEGAALIPPNHSPQNEVYAVGPLTGVSDLNDPQLSAFLSGRFADGMSAKPVGQPMSFQGEGGPGQIHAYDFVKDGTRGRIMFFFVGLRGGGVGSLVAVATPELLSLRQSAIAEVASSLAQSAAPKPSASARTNSGQGGTPLARQWTQHLSDKKLVQFSSYNSGYGSGGYSSEKKLYLASDGSYAFRSSSSVSVYVPGASGSSAGRNGQDGRWRVVDQGGQPLLELIAKDGTTELIRLSMDGTKTFLNGNRWFVVGINE